MTFNSAKDLIKSVHRNKWQTDKKSDGTFITWIPILTLTFDFAPKRIIGLSDDGFWTVQFNTGDIQVIDTRDNCYYILFCLQKGRKEFETLVKNSLIKSELHSGIADTLPVTELLKMTLLTDTHWADQAAFWLRVSDMDNELEGILQAFIDNKRHSQKARHYAFKILKRWQKNR